jgi:hypothetical protein
MKPSLIELKAKAYDILAQVEYLQQELAKVNNAILNYKEEEEEKKEEDA